MTDGESLECLAQDREELMAFLDGELPAGRAVAVHAHVSTCDACQRLTEELHSVSRDLARWHVGDPPASMTAPAAAAPAPTPGLLRRLRFAWRPIVLAPAAAVAVLALVLTFAVHSEKVFERESAGRIVFEARPAAGSPDNVKGSYGQEGRQGQQDKVAGRLESDAERSRTAQPGTAGALVAQPAKPPMIARTVSLKIVATDFDVVRPAVDRILSTVGGFAGQITASGERGVSRSLIGTVRVPADRLAEAVGALKKLGQVIQESQSGEDVTEQAIDLDARLTNARNTEKRLTDVLEHRTGKVGDVLAVEREIARVREEIERFDAERQNVGRRVAYAIVTLEIVEQRKAELDLGPQSVPEQIRNAVVDGFVGALGSVLAVALVIARVAPVLLLWGIVLAWPARIIYRRRKTA
jgi:uncharacterized protein DUF4349/putative zinc finger protein